MSRYNMTVRLNAATGRYEAWSFYRHGCEDFATAEECQDWIDEEELQAKIQDENDRYDLDREIAAGEDW